MATGKVQHALELFAGEIKLGELLPKEMVQVKMCQLRNGQFFSNI
jgi:hypothetical protein